MRLLARGSRNARRARTTAASEREKEPDSHGDVPIYLGLPSRGRHKMAASLAFVEGHSADVDLFAFQWAREVNWIGSNPPHQIRAVTHLAGCRPARSCFPRHR